MFPDGSILPFGIKISKPSEHKIGSKSFSKVTRGNSE